MINTVGWTRLHGGCLYKTLIVLSAVFEEESGLPVIIAAVVGGLLLIALIVILVFILKKRGFICKYRPNLFVKHNCSNEMDYWMK